MRYTSRGEVERIGRAGLFSYQEGDATIARQMASYWLYINPNDKGYTPHALHDGFWEAWITLWMSQNVQPGSVCIDIGTNVGYYTFFLAQHGCTVYGFDPDPKCTKLVQLSNKLNATEKRVTIENMAVTDGKTKEIELWEVEGHSMNNTINRDSTNSNTSFTAKTTSMDAYFARKKDKNQIDFIKIDAEGSEDLIWDGMQKTLNANPTCIVLMEFVAPHYEGNGKPFLSKMMTTHLVSYVDYSGNEQSIVASNFFDTDKEDLRMLVLRKK